MYRRRQRIDNHQEVRDSVNSGTIASEEDENVKAIRKLYAKKDVNEGVGKGEAEKMIPPAVQKQPEVFSQFEVLAKPGNDPKEKIIIDGEVPEGLIYRIQIAVFRNPVSSAYFKGITPIYGFKSKGTDKTYYYAGLFRKLSDANKSLTKVKAKGFKDAFVIAQSDSKTISADRAALLEKEWGKKPLKVITESAVGTPLDTLPPELSYRVEVVRSEKPLKDEVVDEIRKMAGNRGFDIEETADDKIVYLVGKFITFDSAAEYADLLVRNGYREAKVVAYLGKREIPVETAKQLFENLE